MGGEKVGIINKLRYVFLALFVFGLSFSIAWTYIALALLVLNEAVDLAINRKFFKYSKTPFDIIFLCIVLSFVLSVVHRKMHPNEI